MRVRQAHIDVAHGAWRRPVHRHCCRERPAEVGPITLACESQDLTGSIVSVCGVSVSRYIGERHTQRERETTRLQQLGVGVNIWPPILAPHRRFSP